MSVVRITRDGSWWFVQLFCHDYCGNIVRVGNAKTLEAAVDRFKARRREVWQAMAAAATECAA